MPRNPAFMANMVSVVEILEWNVPGTAAQLCAYKIESRFNVHAGASRWSAWASESPDASSLVLSFMLDNLPLKRAHSDVLSAVAGPSWQQLYRDVFETEVAARKHFSQWLARQRGWTRKYNGVWSLLGGDDPMPLPAAPPPAAKPPVSVDPVQALLDMPLSELAKLRGKRT